MESQTLRDARAAYARRAWGDAFALLQEADQAAPLGVEDLERCAWCAGMLDRDIDLFAACERLFNAFAGQGRDDKAAYWAFFHGFRLFALGEQGRASAWMQRAQRHAQQFGSECAAQGYLLLPTVMRHMATGEFTNAGDAAARALAIGERCRENDLVAFAKSLLGRARVRQGRVDEGVALLDEAMLAAVGGALTPIVTGLIYCNLIACCRQVYAWERSREWTRVLSEWCDAQPQLVQFNGQCRLHRAEIMELSGQWQDAVTESRRAAQSVARAISAQTAAGAAYQEAEIHRLRGEFEQAEESYRDASRLGLEPQPGLALLRLAQGQATQGAATLRRVLGETADPLARARLLPAFVEILLDDGASQEARDAVAELERIAGAFATPLLQATAAQARGELDVREGRAADGLAHLRTAIDTWREAGAPYRVARLRTLAGQACRMMGDEDSARLEYDAARGTFEQLGAAPDLARLQSLAKVAPQPIRTAGSLTPREVEVLRLVAAGKTNKRIALDLSLSEKTVDRHLSNIFDKLQVPSRAAATAFAIQHRLL